MGMCESVSDSRKSVCLRVSASRASPSQLCSSMMLSQFMRVRVRVKVKVRVISQSNKSAGYEREMYTVSGLRDGRQGNSELQDARASLELRSEDSSPKIA